MGLTLNKVNDWERVKGTMQVKMKAPNPYVRLKHGRDEPPLYVQQGVVYDEGGTEIKDLPEWFDEELRKVSPSALMEIGWRSHETPVLLATPTISVPSAPITVEVKPNPRM